METQLSAELEDCRRQFEANRREAASLCAALGAEQFNWRPGRGRWSIAECLVHLNISAAVYGPQIDAAIERGQERGLFASGPFRYGFLSRWFRSSLEPPVRRRYRTLRRFVPPLGVRYDVAEVLEQFAAVGRRWEDWLRRANGLDLVRVKVRSPALPLLRFELGALLGGMAAHERRHLWQAHQVRAQPGFPAG